MAVLGNHDYQSDRPGEITALLRESGMTVLEGAGVVIDLPGGRLGIAGTKGFGGGFPGRSASEFGEPEMKAFVHHSRALAEAMGEALRGLDAGFRVALTHYSPVAEAADGADADLCVHGHAHAGCDCGTTPGGAPVRNVALPVLQRAYAVSGLGEPATVGERSLVR